MKFQPINFLLALLLFFVTLNPLAGQSLPVRPDHDEHIRQRIREIMEEKGARPVPEMEVPEKQGHQSAGKTTSTPRATTFKSNPNINEAEAVIVVNPTDTNNVVVSFISIEYGVAHEPIYYTLDGGDTWFKGSISTTDTAIAYYPNLYPTGGGDPALAFTPDGRLIFSWMTLLETGGMYSQIYVNMPWAYSDDGGATWKMAAGQDKYIGQGEFSPFFGPLTNTGDGLFDREWLAADLSHGPYRGNVYVAYAFNKNSVSTLPGDGICVRRMRADSLKWDTTHVLVGTGDYVQYANVAVDTNGYVHLIYMREELGAGGLYHARSTDGGDTWSTPVNIRICGYPLGSVYSRDNMFPNMAVDTTTNTIYVALAQYYFSPGSDLTAFLLYSTDGGTTWSTPAHMAPLIGTTQRMITPNITANDGALSLFWYDVDNNDIADYYMSSSCNQGQTWSTPLKLTAQPTDFSNPQPAAFYGDYYTSAQAGRHVDTTWTDARDGNYPTVYVSKASLPCNSSGLDTVVVTALGSGILLQEFYPNPVREKLRLVLQLEHMGAAVMVLNDMQGRKVEDLWKGTLHLGKNVLELDLSTVAAGTYLLRIDSEFGMITRKLVVD